MFGFYLSRLSPRSSASLTALKRRRSAKQGRGDGIFAVSPQELDQQRLLLLRAKTELAEYLERK